MNVVELWLKRRWHDELVRDPRTHAWVLNLYRVGEHHPETVDDYFPVAHAPAWLASQMERHRAQEAMHERLYAKAIEKLGQPLEELSGLDVFNNAIRAHTPASFKIDAHDASDVVTDKLAHFLAHAHFLEARIARSLEVHLEACVRHGRVEVEKAVSVVWRDEQEHARYTKDAVRELLPAARARDVLALHARAEARANLAFSAREVRAHLSRHASRSRALWRACAHIMELGVARV